MKVSTTESRIKLGLWDDIKWITSRIHSITSTLRYRVKSTLQFKKKRKNSTELLQLFWDIYLHLNEIRPILRDQSSRLQFINITRKKNLIVLTIYASELARGQNKCTSLFPWWPTWVILSYDSTKRYTHICKVISHWWVLREYFDSLFSPVGKNSIAYLHLHLHQDPFWKDCIVLFSGRGLF